MKIGRLTGGVYVVSVLGHIGLGAAVSRVEASPRPDPPPIEISVVDPEPEPEPPKPPPPEPEPDEPEPEELEAPKPEPVTPPKAPPKPAKAPAPAAAPTSGGGAEPFDSGLQLNNGAGGTDVGDGGGGGEPKPAVAPAREVVKKKRVIEAAKPTKACADAPTKPKPLSMPEPEYTAAARAAGIEGKVRLSVTVGADGEVQKVTVIESLDPDLDAAARKAVQGAKFEPATECGEPAAATFKISVKFTL